MQLAPHSFACGAGGRGVVVGPILNQGRSDVFCDNENGNNFLFKNNGDGTFVDMARHAGENSRKPCNVSYYHRLTLRSPNGNISKLTPHQKTQHLCIVLQKYLLKLAC